MTTKTKEQAGLTIKFALFVTLLASGFVLVILALPIILLQALDYPIVQSLDLDKNIDEIAYAVHAVMIVLCYWLIRRRLKNSHDSWQTIGLRGFSSSKAIKYIAGYYGIFVGVVIVAVIAVLLIGGGNLSDPPTTSDNSGDLTDMFWLWIVTSVIVAPIIEEIVFRGVLLTALSRHMRVRYAVLISSALFTLVHLNPISMLSALPLGIYTGIMRYRTNSIIPGIILHASWNLFVMLGK